MSLKRKNLEKEMNEPFKQLINLNKKMKVQEEENLKLSLILKIINILKKKMRIKALINNKKFNFKSMEMH